MSIRRLQYQIDYTHIITFKEEYKPIIMPYFSFDGLEYAIDNENSIHESVRLIFRKENLAIFIRKEGLTFMFEGDINDLKNSNGVIKFFWDIFEQIKSLKGYIKSTRHALIVHEVSIKEKDEVESILNNPPFFSLNPFGALNEFSCIYEFNKSDILHKLQFGNYSQKDIPLHDLSPFRTSFNKDLFDNVGMMARLELVELEKTPTHSKFKSILSKAEECISSLNIFENGK